jgi:hypothetical protein
VLRRVTAILEDPDAAVPDVLRQTIALVVDEVHRLERISSRLNAFSLKSCRASRA